MPLDRQQGWAIAGLAAAAVFAAGSLTAVSIANDQRAAEAREAGSSTTVLDERYRAAIAGLTAAESARRQAECELEARIVEAVQLEQRMASALDAAEIVDNAALIIPRSARLAFEPDRVAAVESFATGFTTDTDAELAARYASVADVVAACLAERITPETPGPNPLTEEAVADAEARAAAASSEPVLDAERLQALEQAIMSFGEPTLAVTDARVAVTGIDETDAALAAAADAARTAPTGAATVELLEALTVHARAAIDAANRSVEPAPQPDPAPAPAPRPRPVNPVPVNPTPAPTADPEPQPTRPVEPGNGGDAPVDPEEP